MKKFIPILSIIAVAIFSANSFAGGNNPGNTQDKRQLEHKEQMRDMDPADRRDAMQKRDDKGEQMRDHQRGDDSKGLDKQREMDRESKELGKGSEQGQKSREEHSRKWWRFWGD